MSIYRREIDTQCCTAWMHGIRTINGQYPDDNRDFDINAGNGIRIEPATGGITIINDSAASSFVAGDNIEITPSGDDLVIGLTSDPVINGDLQVNGDIIQNGSAYETHAEQVYTTKDYIITRDGAISALSAGDYSGFQVKKYDGTNDGRLVIDNAGVARVGDVGDEQPLLTRDESADLTNGDSLVWDGTNQKAITQAIPSAINTALAGKQDLLSSATDDITSLFTAAGVTVTKVTRTIYGKTWMLGIQGLSVTSGLNVNIDFLPSGTTLAGMSQIQMFNVNNGQYIGELYTFTNNKLYIDQHVNAGNFYGYLMGMLN